MGPVSIVAPIVATNVLAAVITSSPGLSPKTFKAIFIASVPESTPTAYFVPISFEKLFHF